MCVALRSLLEAASRTRVGGQEGGGQGGDTVDLYSLLRVSSYPHALLYGACDASRGCGLLRWHHHTFALEVCAPPHAGVQSSSGAGGRRRAFQTRPPARSARGGRWLPRRRSACGVTHNVGQDGGAPVRGPPPPPHTGRVEGGPVCVGAGGGGDTVVGRRLKPHGRDACAACEGGAHSFARLADAWAGDFLRGFAIMAER